MEDVAGYNRQRWKALAEADALFTRPLLGLDPQSTMQWDHYVAFVPPWFSILTRLEN